MTDHDRTSFDQAADDTWVIPRVRAVPGALDRAVGYLVFIVAIVSVGFVAELLLGEVLAF